MIASAPHAVEGVPTALHVGLVLSTLAEMIVGGVQGRRVRPRPARPARCGRDMA